MSIGLCLLGDPLRKAAYASDEWVSPNQHTRVDVGASVTRVEKTEFDLLFDSASFFIPSKLVAIPKYHTNADNLDYDVER